MPDDTFLCILRTRLRCDLTPPGSRCAYVFQSNNRTCGASLGAAADHAHICCSAKVNARHKTLHNLWPSYCRQAGYLADKEQSVPKLGSGNDVVADVRAVGGPAERIRYADVVVTHPVQVLAGRVSGCGPGVAAAREERKKFGHYKPRLGGRSMVITPLSFESTGAGGSRRPWSCDVSPPSVANLRMPALRSTPLRSAEVAYADGGMRFLWFFSWRISRSTVFPRTASVLVHLRMRTLT